MSDLAKRLQKVMREGKLTKQDLARWFERPYPTVRLWIIGKQQPWEMWRDDVEKKLRALETLVSRGKHLPIPASYTFKDRAELMQALIDERDSGVSGNRSATRR